MRLSMPRRPGTMQPNSNGNRAQRRAAERLERKRRAEGGS